MPARPAIDIPLFIREIVDRQPDRRGEDDLRPEHSGRHVRPRLSDRDAVRGSLRARTPKASRCRSAACSATPPTPRWREDGSSTARRADRQEDGRRRSGPAGLAAAHRLARYGHDVTMFEARPKAGGLNEYGIAAYKSDRRLRAGRGRLRHRDRRHHDRETARRSAATSRLPIWPAATTRCFLGMGLAGVNALRADGEEAAGVDNAVEFIAELRQAARSRRAAGRPARRRHRRRHDGDRRRGAVEAARRRGGDDLLPARQGAHERLRLRAGSGLDQRRHHPPLAAAEAGHCPTAARSPESSSNTPHVRDGSSSAPARRCHSSADQVFKAIGQTFVPSPLNGSGAWMRWRMAASRSTPKAAPRMPKVWAGGDCIVRRRRPDRVGGRARARRGREHPPAL